MISLIPGAVPGKRLIAINTFASWDVINVINIIYVIAGGAPRGLSITFINICGRSRILNSNVVAAERPPPPYVCTYLYITI